MTDGNLRKNLFKELQKYIILEIIANFCKQNCSNHYITEQRRFLSIFTDLRRISLMYSADL
jgi:hypothetical protein